MAVYSNRRKSGNVASRGCSPQNIPTNSWSGPKWLQDQNSWSPDEATGPNNETESEAKVIKEVLSIAVGEDDQQDDLSTKYRLWKTLRIKTWIRYNQRQDTIKGENQRTYHNY